MAIQISGTTVINDSRGLTNIASVDATTAASVTSAGVDFSAIGVYSSTSAPSSPSVGDCYFDSTEGSKGTLYIYDGSEWGGNALE